MYKNRKWLCYSPYTPSIKTAPCFLTGVGLLAGVVAVQGGRGLRYGSRAFLLEARPHPRGFRDRAGTVAWQGCSCTDSHSCTAVN